ncbi:peroxidase 2-like [Brachypodium distachyon]|uniref:Peroxidase n=1 Tax=Brachypodium distachyon TaxID=15368 RepID=I1HMT3_BRADI|nr:peroxidase 2-like [Brachypodium distachyon]KQK07968.1 hypothetical protein BRADI_2g38690v3 [Brachypodium distachyon]|eukprot:XP_024314194.1 peroxidase 2-like [Brachypodium distachyon]
MAKGSVSLVLVAFAVLLAAQLKPAVAVDGRYNTTMQEKVRKIVEANRYDAPGLIRILFHDCWVKGCDASVLLNVTEDKNEIHAPQNGGLRGMGVIQAIKDALVAANYENVSCTDALIFAAREATVVLSNYTITYDVDGPGRKDSNISVAGDAGVLPPPFADFGTLLTNFQNKTGFGLDELVILSGAHSVGRAHRAAFDDRLNKAVTPSSQIDDDYRNAIDKKTSTHPTWLQAVMGAKPTPDMAATAENNIRDMDDVRGATKYNATGVKLSPKNVLDNSYYTNNGQNMVLFKSDWVLRTNKDAAAAMKLYRENPVIWYGLFGQAMAKLSELAPERLENEFVAGGARKYCDKIEPAIAY